MSSPSTDPLDAEQAVARHKLASDLDLTQAKPLLDQLIALFKIGEIKLDACDVDRVSAACVQVLMSAGYSAHKASVPFTIETPSDSFLKALADLGVQAEFKNWMN